jgi:hypothetical protein
MLAGQPAIKMLVPWDSAAPIQDCIATTRAIESGHQGLSIQHGALKTAGCEVVCAEKASGTRRDGRTELQVLLDFLRDGDKLVITRIDRLARSLKIFRTSCTSSRPGASP